MFLSKHMPTVLVILLLSILIFGSSIFLSQPSLVRAADLSQASIKLTRQKANTNPGPILVQLRTTENDVEDGIRLTVLRCFVFHPYLTSGYFER